MSSEVILGVAGMTCGGCENAVQRAVGQLAGVTQVTATHRDNTVRVTYDPAVVTRAEIERKIGTLGYTVAAA